MAVQNSTGSIITTIENKIATIEFGHPASNSFPSDLLSQLTNEFNTLSVDPAVAIIVLKSIGSGVFCAGASFDELLAISNHEAATKFFSGFANVINAMRTCSKLIIGRIQGKAVGGGVGIAAACDYTFATTESSIKLSELSIGIGPFVIEPAVSRKIGKSALSEMTLDTEWKTANWANQKGLYSKVFATISEMDIEISQWSNTVAKYNPEALLELKKMFWEGTENWASLLYERAEISGKLVLSNYTKNALTQYKNK